METPTLGRALSGHARAAFERLHAVRDDARTRPRHDLAELLEARGYVAHEAVLRFEEQWGGLCFPESDELGPSWHVDGGSAELWAIGPWQCLSEGRHGDPRGGASGVDNQLVPVALGPSDFIAFMDASGRVWGQDTIEAAEATPLDRSGALFVARTLLWCEMVSAGLQPVAGGGGELAERLGLPPIGEMSDEDCRYWGDGATFVMERVTYPEGDLDDPRPWVMASSRDPSVRSSL